jgi:O-antigen ligase
MTTKQRVDTREGLTWSSQTKVPWASTTALGSVIAFVLPFNSQLPSVPRGSWFVCIVALIGIPMLLMQTGRRPLYPAVWAFAGYASLVAILTATKSATIVENLFIGAQLVLLVGFGPFAMTANALIDPKFVQRVSVAFLGGQSLSAIVAISQLLGRPVLGSEPLQGRAYGLAEHPNTLGLLSCLAILIALQMLLATRRFRLLAFGALVANIIALIASGSVSSMMALSIGLAVLIISRRDLLGKMALGIIACAVALWLVGKFSGVFNYLPSLTGRYGQVTGQTESVSSWGLRTLTYEFAWTRISEEPIFGVGLSPKYSGTYNGITVTHNVFLRAWYQGGFLFAVAIALIVIAVLIVTFRAMIRKEHSGEASVLIAIFAFALTSALFEQRHFWLPVIVAWASISAAAIRQKGSHWHRPSPRGIRCIG